MVAVRRASVDDADAIGRVQVETWRAAYGHLLPDDVVSSFDESERQRLWREGLSRTPRPGSATFVAELDGQVVGFASVGASREEEHRGELYAIYLHPTAWGRGVGRALIEQAEASMREHGFPEALLWVIDGNERASRFYEAAGWSADGSKLEDFQGAEVTELRYRKTL